MDKYNIHSDFIKLENMQKPNLSPMLLPLMNGIVGGILNRMRPAKNIYKTKKKIYGHENGLIELIIYEPQNIKKNAPCVIYLHGGAFVLKVAPYHINLICEYALRVPCKVVFVDYRLAPKYPFPFGVEDCYSAFKWVYENAEEIGIDKNKIALCGDSAGGALAACVCLMAQDRKAPHISCEMLVYPVTDARQSTESMKIYTDTPMWDSKLNEKMWELYLKDGINTKREYASPMEAPSFKNLPPSYIEVAEFDCLKDEGINFANALKQSGIDVELYKTIGTIHGYDMEEKSPIVRESVNRRIEFLKKNLNK